MKALGEAIIILGGELGDTRASNRKLQENQGRMEQIGRIKEETNEVIQKSTTPVQP